MLKYIVRRIFIFIPTLFAISLIAFVISINAPGDPVESLFTGQQGGEESSGTINAEMLRQKDTLRHQLGLDLPVFYFTVTSLSSPDTLYKVFDKNRKASLERLIDTYGNWQEISAWSISVEELRNALREMPPDTGGVTDLAKQEVMALQASYEEVVIDSKLKKLETMTGKSGEVAERVAQSRKAFDAMKANASTWKNWMPAMNFYGYNQYHRWLFGDGNWITGKGAKHTEGVIRGDFGKSYATKDDVTKTIARAIPWSLSFTLVSVFLAYLISIPVGVQAAAKRGSLFDRSSSVVLFMLYSLPPFFMGTLLLLAFANPAMWDIFPASGVGPATGYPEGLSTWDKARIALPYYVLPLICYTYSSLAFLSRTMRVAMLEVVGQDYIRTAKAKGLTYYLVIYKHGLRNALLPIITVFANIFPAAVGGSVILEFVFGIPGMGQEIYQAVQTRDYPMIVAVFTLSGFMTLVGYLVADILYAVVDPRISYSRR